MQYKARRMSKNTIKYLAKYIRKSIGLKKDEPFPVIRFLSTSLSGLKENQFTLEILEDSEMKTNFAETNMTEKTMKVRQSVYDGAVLGDEYCLKILKHELGHYFLHFDAEVIMPKNNSKIKIPKEEDTEWQADVFSEYI